jgi:hypothetical protein
LELILASSAPVAVELSQTHKCVLNCVDIVNWKLTPNPRGGAAVLCKNYRLILPALKDEGDYNRCAEFLQKVEAIQSIQLNLNTGFRLYVSAKGLKCDGFVRVCQNFVKYEDAIDSVLPLSRRSGSAASQSYFQSNKTAPTFRPRKNGMMLLLIAGILTTSSF